MKLFERLEDVSCAFPRFRAANGPQHDGRILAEMDRVFADRWKDRQVDAAGYYRSVFEAG